MKKIMFNDRYGLTQAVLEGRKTQTPRAAYPRYNIYPHYHKKRMHGKNIHRQCIQCRK